MTTIRAALIEALIEGGDEYAAQEVRRGASDALVTVARRTSQSQDAANRNRRRDVGAETTRHCIALERARQLANRAAYVGVAFVDARTRWPWASAWTCLGKGAQS